MEWWAQAAIIIGMFILRLGVPLAITLLVGYWLRRLDARWQAEAEERRQQFKAQQKAAVEPPIEMFRILEQPCWVFKDCPQNVRWQCPAFQQPQLRCWEARRAAEGQIPAACFQCELFSRGATREKEPAR